MKCSKMIPSNLSRRDFLLYASMSSALYVLCSATNYSSVWASSDENYYRINSERFTRSFEHTVSSAKTYLSTKYDDATAHKVCTTARNEFKQLLPGLPYIGGDQHPGTKWLLLTAHWISFMRPMQERGYSTEAAARMMYDLYVEYLNTIPKDKMTKRGAYKLSQEYINIMKKWSHNSKTQRIDWVADYIPGDKKHFDYGIDYLYCPCFEYFKTQGAKNIAPYFCLLDFPEHKIMGTGLVRKKTLAQGDDICDFRYKKGRAVTQNWSTEVSKFG